MEINVVKSVGRCLEDGWKVAAATRRKDGSKFREMR